MYKMSKKSSNHYFVANPKSKMKLGTIRTVLRGRTFEFLTSSGLFSKKRVDLGTRLLIESMILPEDGLILDVGCGYGAIGIAAATFNPNLSVVMVDVNKRAIWLTKQNIKRNNLSNIEVRRGHLYEPAKDLNFNCILSNPPISVGMKAVTAMIVGAPKHMANKACFQMVVRSKIGKKRLRTLLEKVFGNTEILAKKSGYRVFISEKQ